MEAFERAEQLADDIKEYVDTRIELAKLGTAEKASLVISNLVAGIAVSVVFLIFFQFINAAMALLLAKTLGSAWIGFLVLSAFYLLVALILWGARERIVRIPIMNNILSQLFNDHKYRGNGKI